MEVRLQFFLMMMFCFKDIVARNVDVSYVSWTPPLALLAELFYVRTLAIFSKHLRK